MSNNVRLLEKPLLLVAGSIGFYQIEGKKHVIQVCSDDGVTVEYTFPLKPSDTKVHSIAKAAVFCALSDLGNYAHLSLKTTNEKLKNAYGEHNRRYDYDHIRPRY